MVERLKNNSSSHSRIITKEILGKLSEYNQSIVFKYGLIAMEFLSGFETLSDYEIEYNEGPEYNEGESMARYEIARLYQLGYIHGDLHKDNILIHPDYSYFDIKNEDYSNQGDIYGRVMLIDFGSTFKLEPCKLLDIQASNDDHTMYEIYPYNFYKASHLSFIIDSPGYRVGTAINTPLYEWLNIKTKDEVNKENDKLFKLLEKRVNVQQELIERIHRQQEEQKEGDGGKTVIDSPIDNAFEFTSNTSKNAGSKSKNKKKIRNYKTKKNRNYKTKKNKFLHD
jgi:hypothetical protein